MCKREASGFLLWVFLIMFFSQNTYFSHPLLSDHPLFCNQKVDLAELKCLGSCRDETQLNKQILKWCLDGRTWTWFRFFLIHLNVWLNAAHYSLSSILHIQFFYCIIILRVENEKGTILPTLIIEEEQLCLYYKQ